MKIVVINGPNLNLLGTREPGIYGDQTFEEYYESLISDFPQVTFDYFQSNIEGALIDCIQKEGFSCDGILLNAAAYTHTSVGIGDAIKAIDAPVIEIHISNIYKREPFRHKSLISDVATAQIAGLGIKGYSMALKALAEMIQ